MSHLITVYKDFRNQNYVALYPEGKEEPLIVARVPKEVVMRALQFFKTANEDHGDHVVLDANGQQFKRIAIFLAVAERHPHSEHAINALLARVDALDPLEVEFWFDKLVYAYEEGRRKMAKTAKAFLSLYF
jgi:hypothetical protein